MIKNKNSLFKYIIIASAKTKSCEILIFDEEVDFDKKNFENWRKIMKKSLVFSDIKRKIRKSPHLTEVSSKSIEKWPRVMGRQDKKK